jgi:hypothetical protein
MTGTPELTGLAKLEQMEAPERVRKAAIKSAEAMAAALDLGNRVAEMEARFEKFVLEEHLPLLDRLDAIERRLMARNKSSSTKRDMTDEDAKEVLIGVYKDMSHKTAEGASNLTYAQVYSCRLEYTFKHVHKELRQAGWKNPWAKK